MVTVLKEHINLWLLLSFYSSICFELKQYSFLQKSQSTGLKPCQRLVINLQKQPPEVFCNKGALRNLRKFTEKHNWQSLFFNKVASLRLAQVFSCKFCEISKNTFLTEYLRAAASKFSTKLTVFSCIILQFKLNSLENVMNIL